MKNSSLQFAGLSLAFALALAPALRANLNFSVDIDTASLSSAPNAPFYLDFQLNEGSGSLPNSVALSDFTFDVGHPVGAATALGNTSGSLGSEILLNDDPSSPWNEIFQQFSADTTAIHFEVSVSQNVAGVTPDSFVVGILDSETGLPQIGTTAPDGVSLVTLDLGENTSLSDVKTFSSTSPSGVIATPGVPVPEASTMGLTFAAATAALAGLRFRARRRAI